MSKGVFITGTDTGIGKTRFTLALMQMLKKQGQRVSGMKPVATGAMASSGRLINDDAKLIMEQCTDAVDYKLINPAVYELPVSPHIAANQSDKAVDLDQIVTCYEKLALDCDNIIVEGVGGWRVPISDDLSIVDLVRTLDLPVIMVVGLKLGCINHAVLTAEAVRADNIELLGWVSNQLEQEYLFVEETVNTIKKSLACPYIGHLSYATDLKPNEASEQIDLSVLSGFLNL